MWPRAFVAHLPHFLHLLFCCSQLAKNKKTKHKINTLCKLHTLIKPLNGATTQFPDEIFVYHVGGYQRATMWNYMEPLWPRETSWFSWLHSQLSRLDHTIWQIIRLKRSSNTHFLYSFDAISLHSMTSDNIDRNCCYFTFHGRRILRKKPLKALKVCVLNQFPSVTDEVPTQTENLFQKLQKHFQW